MTLRGIYIFFILFFFNNLKCQVANMVQNGGFEDYDYVWPYNYVKHWSAIVPGNSYFGFLMGFNATPTEVPLNTFTYQWPHNGNNYFIFENLTGYRGYPMNRLNGKLKANSAYCVKMYLNLSNQSTYGISNMGCFFADESIDTITNCNSPLTYLTPQILNGSQNFLTDTMNWMEIKGQFTATGNEKYLIVGNFFSLNASNKKLTNPTNLPTVAADYLIDDVSVIEIGLPAFAGADQSAILGDSVYIGRESDIGIDEACTWYKLPNDSIPIDTIAGFWVKPVSTCTYMVRQEICGNVKWDTVVLYENPVGIAKWNILYEGAKIYPNPAKDHLQIEVSPALSKMEISYSIYSCVGSLIREEEIRPDYKTGLDVSMLDPGVYSFILRVSDGYSVTKKFVIAR